MATPYNHTHVSYVGRTGRRRSQSLSVLQDDPENVTGLNSQQKQFLSQLQKVRQNRLKTNKEEVESIGDEQNDKKQHSKPVITQISEVANASTSKIVSTSIRKQKSTTDVRPTTSKNEEEYRPTVSKVSRGETAKPTTSRNEEEYRPTTSKLSRGETAKSPVEMRSTTSKNESEFRPNVSKVSRAETTKSTKNLISSEELPSTSGFTDVELSPNDIDHDLNDDEQPTKSHPQIVRVPRVESTVSMAKHASSKPKTANITVGPAAKSSNLDSSNGSAYPFLSSSKNLMSRSEIFDQDSCPTDEAENGKYKKINISGNSRPIDRKVVARSSASLMTAVIAIILGIIAFAFGLAALILVQRLRSLVDSQLALTTTSSPKYSAGWQLACSSYKVDPDATRSVRAPGYALGCDDTAPFLNRTTPIWLRFNSAGGTQLPLTTPGMNICGSEGTGYYVGTMPAAGELVNGTACFTWYTSVCRFSLSISVANCGSFYVYYLPPAPACMMRYCTI